MRQDEGLEGITCPATQLNPKQTFSSVFFGFIKWNKLHINLESILQVPQAFLFYLNTIKQMRVQDPSVSLFFFFFFFWIRKLKMSEFQSLWYSRASAFKGWALPLGHFFVFSCLRFISLQYFMKQRKLHGNHSRLLHFFFWTLFLFLFWYTCIEAYCTVLRLMRSRLPGKIIQDCQIKTSGVQWQKLTCRQKEQSAEVFRNTVIIKRPSQRLGCILSDKKTFASGP